MITPLGVGRLSTRAKTNGFPSGKQPATRSEHDRKDQQYEFVNQIPANKRLDQLPAAKDAKTLVVLTLKSGHCIPRITFQEGRVLPWERLLESP